MHLNDYQDHAATTAVYPRKVGEQALTYTVLGLVGEAGELAQKVKRKMRDQTDETEFRKEMALELGDCLWYIAMAAHELGVSLDVIAQLNVQKLAGRSERGTLRGEGDHR